MKRYNPADIETKWQTTWAKNKTYKAHDDSSKPKYYALSFFPYPSGAGLHLGHVRNFTITDVVARYKRMQGFEVLHPMGWDSFGLPGENYAIKTGIAPQVSVKENSDNFRLQSQAIGLSVDWDREFSSTDPEYYRWTQWFFKLLFKKGLAYQKESLQFWCETDKTVLANEQVEAGKCWRCGNLVTKKSMKQWFFKITDYADRLVTDLDKIDWPEGIIQQQRNWIGKSVGAEVEFKVDGTDEVIRVFTTRSDTLFGATFMVLAPEHELVASLTTDKYREAVMAYVTEAQAKTDIDRMDESREKTGVFTGSYAINPVNGAKVPVWIADYVLAGYGTGAIMAVPAHDERDNTFAQKFNLPIIEVVQPYFVYEGIGKPREGMEWVERDVVDAIIVSPDGKYLLQSETGNTHFVGGGTDDEADEIAIRREVLEEVGFTDIESIRLVSSTIGAEAYRIPKALNTRTAGRFYEVKLASLAQQKSEIEEGRHTVEWVDKTEVATRITWPVHSLAWQQYIDGNFCYHGDGVMMNSGVYDGLQSADAREQIVAQLASKGAGSEKVNYRIRDWLISRQRYWGAPIPIVHCVEHGAVAIPDDQLPLVLPELEDYAPSDDGRSPLARATEWLQTTCPECSGPAIRETDTMDGFACSSWYFLRFADPHNNERPFDTAAIKKWLPVDMYIGGAEHAVMHLLYARMWTKVMFDEGMIEFDEPFMTLRNQGMLLASDGTKISKSKGNGIDPMDIIKQGYGADALRTINMFLAPYNQSTPWSDEGLAGSYRFLNRVWTLVQEYLENNVQSEAPLVDTHRSIKKVTDDLGRLSFNTAIAAQMELVNSLYKAKTSGMKGDSWQFALTSLVQLVAPFAPHMAEELWQQLGQEGSVHLSSWPTWDDSYLMTDTMTIVVQVNGKVRAELSVPKDITEAGVTEQALSHDRIKEFVGNKKPTKVIYVPGRLVNIVV